MRTRKGCTLLALVLVTFGCESTTQSGRALVIGQSAGVRTFDPAAVTSAESALIVTQVYETLVRLDRGDRRAVRPWLARSWSVKDGGRSWTFELRRGVHFHDGSQLTADDVVYSFERQRDPKHRDSRSFPYWRANFSSVQKTTKLGRYRVRLRLDKPFAPLLRNLGLFAAAIVKPNRKPGAPLLGTGPYRFFAKPSPGRRVVLERNTRHWSVRPTLRRLVFEMTGSDRQRLVGLQSGTIDLVYSVPPRDRALVHLHPDLRLHRVGGENVSYLAMNTRRPAFADVRVRRAINHAINKELILKLVFQGYAVAAHGPLPPGMWAHEKDVRRYAYNPKRARQLLKQAGFDTSRRIRLFVMSTPRPYLPAPLLVARIVARNLAQVGLVVELVVNPHKKHLEHVRRGEHDLCLLGWVADNGDPDNFLYVLLDRDNAAAGSAQNVAFFDDARVHRLLIEARHEMNSGKRELLYRKAQKIIAEQAPWVPLAHQDVSIVHRSGLRGIRLDATNSIDFGGVGL
jgi:peptide/nickel transport system substrate-binding protein